MSRSGFLIFFGLFLATIQVSAQNKVCFTIDDLPLQRPGLYDPAGQKAVTDKILASLVKYHIPAIGFVNESRLYINGRHNPERVQLLESWLAAGMEIGNHTFSHADYNTTPLEEFKEEIRKGQLISDELCAKYHRPVKYFRHPYLRRGDTPEKVSALEAYLREIGLTEAPVTIDNSEWIFAAAWDSVCKTSDTALLNTIGSTYLKYMEDKLHYYEHRSQKLFGYNINQILLIHANDLNANYLDDLAEMLIRNGYSFISLTETLEDNAFRSEDKFTKGSGITWLDRWALTKGYKGEYFAGEPVCPEFIKSLAKTKYE